MAKRFGSNILFPLNSSDPGTPTEAEVWYNSTLDKFKYQDGAGTKVIMSEELLASTTGGEGSGLVGFSDPTSNFTATTVQAALAEIRDDLLSAANGNGASTVGVEDSVGNFTGTDVEAVLAEIDLRIDGITTDRDFVNSVNLDVNYLMNATGTPAAGSGKTEGEILINAVDEKYWKVVSGAWADQGALGTKRFVFKTSGTGTGMANVTATSNNKIYDGEFFSTAFTPTIGTTFDHEADQRQWTFNNSSVWVKTGARINHNDHPDLQGGGAGDYNHLTTAELNLLQEIDSTAATEGATRIALDAASTVGGVYSNVQAALTALYDAGVNATDTYTEGATTLVATVAETITHNLNSRYVHVTAYTDNAGNPQNEEALEIAVTGLNTITATSVPGGAYHFVVSAKE